VAALLVLVAVGVWLTVLVGTYVSFPPYRAAPAEGVTDLRPYPKALIQSQPESAWLPSLAMETKAPTAQSLSPCPRRSGATTCHESQSARATSSKLRA